MGMVFMVTASAPVIMMVSLSQLPIIGLETSVVKKSKRNCTICNGLLERQIIHRVFLPSYIRGGLADGVLCGKGGGRGLSRGSAGAGSAGHIPGISLALDVGVVQRHGGGGVTVVNYVLNYLIKFCL